jgi:pimeloyl-ACP methyl ester carboxylesterase
VPPPHLEGPSRPWCWCTAPGPTAAARTRWWPACNARATRSSPSPARDARSPTTARSWPPSGTASRPLVLVGHAYGGAVITNAATGNEHVKALGQVDASLPAQGEPLAQLLGTRRAPVCPAPHRGLRPAALPGARPGVVDTDGNQGLFPSWFANDLPARTGGRPGRHPAAISTVTLGQPSGPPAWAEMPSWALVGTVDRVILPATQRFLAERAGARIVKVKASPLSLISRPGPVTGLIVAADRATR